jgi:hypothetical protein
MMGELFWLRLQDIRSDIKPFISKSAKFMITPGGRFAWLAVLNENRLCLHQKQ